MASAQPEPPQAELRFAAPSEVMGCPTQRALERAVAARLGYWPFTAGHPRTVSARIELSGKELVGLVELHGPNGKLEGSRRLSSPTGDCSELTASLELAISIAIDPEVMLRPMPAPGTAPPEPPEAQAVPAAPPALVEQTRSDPPPARVEPRAAPRERLSVRGGASAFVSIGSLPAAHMGFGAQLFIHQKVLAFGVEGRVDLPAAQSIKGPGEVEASLFAGALSTCGHWRWFSTCGVVTLGALLGRGVELERTARSTSVFAALGVRAAADLSIYGPLSLRLFAEPSAVLSRTTLRVNGKDVWSSPPATLSVGLALVGRFR